MYVINSNGEKEPFSFQKLYRSIRRVGTPPKLAMEIANAIEKEVYSGISTSDIFKKVKRLIYPRLKRAALRFNLKKGMRKLGPSGFPFEKFIGEIFKKMGFEVKINQHLPGFCLKDYEIDFIAKKGNLIYVGECKYRNYAGEKVHSKDALVNYARFLDILKGPYFKTQKYKNFKVKSVLVTNEKFTTSSLVYSKCNNIGLLGWKYPKNRGLEYLIEEYALYPITILPSLRGPLREIFVSEKMMLVQDVVKINPKKFSKIFRVPPKLIFSLTEEAKSLLKI